VEGGRGEGEGEGERRKKRRKEESKWCSWAWKSQVDEKVRYGCEVSKMAWLD
jgi:hypothetical protein